MTCLSFITCAAASWNALLPTPARPAPPPASASFMIFSTSLSSTPPPTAIGLGVFVSLSNEYDRLGVWKDDAAGE